MKRHISKAAMKDRLAQRKARQARQIAKDTTPRDFYAVGRGPIVVDGVGRSGIGINFPPPFGTPYQTPEQRKLHRWICGVVQASIRRAREGSRVARIERKHVDRVAKDGYISWEDAFERGRRGQ